MPVREFPPERIGLCVDCMHAKELKTKNDYPIYMCTLAEKDSRFLKYPRLPMRECSGYKKILLLIVCLGITLTAITPGYSTENSKPASKCNLKIIEFSSRENPWRKIGTMGNSTVEYTPDSQDFDPQEFDRKNDYYSYLYLGKLKVKTPSAPSPCEIPVNLVSSVYLADSQQVLAITSWSGSTAFLTWIDAKTCENIFSASGYTPKIVIQKNRAAMSGECECGDPCVCNSAQIFSMDSNCRPKLLEEESKKITQKELGVSFLGARDVFNPKTKKAQLAPEKNPQNP